MNLPAEYDQCLNTSIHRYLKKARLDNTLSHDDIVSIFNWIPTTLAYCNRSETYRLVVLFLDICKYHHENDLPFTFLLPSRLRELVGLIFKFRYQPISRKVFDILDLLLHSKEWDSSKTSEIIEVRLN
jgi:hypothetical protein